MAFTRLMRPLASLTLVCFLAQLLLPVAAFAQGGGFRTVQLGVTRSSVIAFEGTVKRVSLGNPAVADFNVLSKSEVMVLGLKTGRTELYVWMEEGAMVTYDLHVVDDLADFREKLARVLGGEASGRIHAVLAGGMGKESIVLRGTVASQAEAEAAQDVAELYYKCMNLLEVRDPRTAVVRPNEGLGGFPEEADRTSRIFALRHAQAAEIKPVLDKLKSADGTLEVDPRTNALVVIDRPAVVQRMTSILTVLDQPEPQVMIEAKIIEVSLGDDMKSAFNWIYETLYNGTNAIGSAMNNKVIAVKDGALTGTFDYGKISNDHFTMQILPALSKRKSRLVSSPTAVTLNKKEALIKIQDTVPTAGDTTKDSFGQTTTAKVDKEVGVTLKVTPTVVDRDNITLNLFIKEDNLVEKVEYATGQFGYRTSNRESTNIVNVAENETLVIGGLIKDESLNTHSKVPLVGNIPYLKNAFKQFTNEGRRREILIFITTRLIHNARDAKVDAVKFYNIAAEDRKFEEEQAKSYEKRGAKEREALPKALPVEPRRGVGMKEIPELTRKLAVRAIDPEAAPAPQSAPVPRAVAKDEPIAKPAPVAKAEPQIAKVEPAEKPAPAAKSEPVVKPAVAAATTPAPKRALRSAEAKALLAELKAGVSDQKTPPAAAPVDMNKNAAAAEPVAVKAPAVAAEPAAPAKPAPVAEPVKSVANEPGAPAVAAKPVAKTETTPAVRLAEKPVETPVAKTTAKSAAKSATQPSVKKTGEPLRSTEAKRLLAALKQHAPASQPAPAAPAKEPAARQPEAAAPAPAAAPAEAKAEPPVPAPAAARQAATDPLDPALIKKLATKEFKAKISGIDGLAKHLNDRMDKNEMKQALDTMRQSAAVPAGGTR